MNIKLKKAAAAANSIAAMETETIQKNGVIENVDLSSS
jgi:hypothetical protein